MTRDVNDMMETNTANVRHDAIVEACDFTSRADAHRRTRPKGAPHGGVINKRGPITW
jgi:hypothetical protein